MLFIETVTYLEIGNFEIKHRKKLIMHAQICTNLVWTYIFYIMLIIPYILWLVSVTTNIII